MTSLAASIRTIPDYPKPGVRFRDITTLLGNARAFRRAIDELVHPYAGEKIDKIAGIEARGFLFAAALAQLTGHGLVIVRKPGKLPGPTIGHDYALEYGVDRLELHEGQVPRGARVLLVDDVLATGGTAVAAVTLLEKAGGSVGRALFVAELDGLGGAGRLLDAGVEPVSLLHYPA